jgi:putative oxygen-independent coproporphyrinogen III oxidase
LTTAPAPLGVPVPLGVYVHWPYCARICPYCDFNVLRDRGRKAEQAALAKAIIQDLEAQRALTGPRRLVSVFFGGGTPSLMAPEWAGEIVETARRLWTPEPDLEVTLEANPTDAETARFEAFASAGVSRLSLGVQSLDDEALAFLGRNHGALQAIAAAEAARAAFPRLSIDLIYARPGLQLLHPFGDGLAGAALGAEHISPYQLTIEAGTAFDRAVRRKSWAPPPEALAADFYDATQETLSAEGFEAYEVSNHARGEAARSRHNLVYWRGQDYVGAGPGAHGRLTLEGRRTATRAHAGVAAYVASVAETGVGWEARETLSRRERAEERLLTGLRTLEGVGLDEIDPLRPDPAQMRALSDAGLMELNADKLIATAAGRLVLDRLTAELAAALRDLSWR